MKLWNIDGDDTAENDKDGNCHRNKEAGYDFNSRIVKNKQWGETDPRKTIWST